MSAGSSRSCPSYPPVAGARLFGVVDPELGVRHLPYPLEVDHEMAKTLRSSGRAGDTLRLAGQCGEGRCGHWNDGRCTLIDRTLAAHPVEDAMEPLPPCGIRPGCRWFGQSGRDACHACVRFLSGNLPIEAIPDSEPERNSP